MGDRETRWVDDYLHRISEALVQEAIAHDCDMIAFEELTDIRDRMPNAKKFHAWTFHRLYDHTAYKAKAEEVDVTQIDLGLHELAVLEVRDDASGESAVAGAVLLPEVRLRSERRLQRGKEYRIQDTPREAKVSARRGDTSPRPEVGDVERE